MLGTWLAGPQSIKIINNKYFKNQFFLQLHLWASTEERKTGEKKASIQSFGLKLETEKTWVISYLYYMKAWLPKS